MAVLQMQRISICALKKDRKPILELLQRRGVIEINDEIPEDSVFYKADVTKAEFLLEKNVASAKEALQILETYLTEKKSILSILEGRKEVSTDVYGAFGQKYDSVVRIVNRVCSLTKEIAEYKAEILKLETQMEILSPWMSLDIPMSFSGTKNTSGFIGCLPNAWSLEQIYDVLAEHTPIHVDIISSSREQTNLFLLCTKENADAVFEGLRAVGFSHPNSIVDKIPKEQFEELTSKKAIAVANILQAEEEIQSYSQSAEDIRFLMDYDTMRAEKYKVIGQLLQSNKVFFLHGFIPEVEAQEISDVLNQRFMVNVELDYPTEEEEVPVLLHNNGFCNPLEGTVEAYSPPGKGDVDPTMVMSLFYYILFGIMLSDAGYGAIIAIGCGFALVKYKDKLEESMRKTLKMFLFCGISTVFWGIMFGSYFGDVIDVISITFFNKAVTVQPLWFVPMNDPMKMLVFSLAFGVVHVLTGLGVKLYLCIKAKDYKAALYDAVFWFVLLISAILMLLPTQMFADIVGTRIQLPEVITKVTPFLFILSTVGIICTNGRESKNPFKRFLKGLYAYYGITGYLSDVLSYSRLLALGLATGVICMVINKMASMVGGGIVGAILFTIIVIFGNILNIAINALGAYVHTNRLQYVEFFGKFYEGGGRKFNPFSVKTKFYKFKEKIKHE